MNSGLIKKICPVTGLDIIESSRWTHLKLAENYVISFRKIGAQIVDVHGFGNVNDFDAIRFQNFLDRFLEDQQIQMPYIEIRNYEDISGVIPSKETLKIQKDYFIENKNRRVGFIAYNAPAAIGMLLQSGKRQYSRINVEVRTEKNYEKAITGAITLINQKKTMQKPKTKKTYKISSESIEQVALFCGKFLWEENDYYDLEEVSFDAKNPLFPIVENLMIVREELLNLEADSIVKSKALEQEKLQTEKIVESLQSGILIIDVTKQRIVDVNPAACKLLHAEKEQLIGKEYHQFVEDDADRFSYKLHENNAKESKIFALNDTVIPILRSSVRIKLGGKDYVLENLIDMSDAKEHEEKLRKSLAHTKQLNNLTFNREKRIIEMKTEVNELLKELGQAPKYKSVIPLKKEIKNGE